MVLPELLHVKRVNFFEEDKLIITSTPDETTEQ